MRIFIAGGTGLVGARLAERLENRGAELLVLTRRPAKAKELYGAKVTAITGDPAEAGPWMDDAATCDAIINLAGEGVFNRRWSEDFKKLLVESRVKSTENVVAALMRVPATAPQKVLINASAIGYYGFQNDQLLTESSPPGNDFLAKLCIAWERAAAPADSAGIRHVTLRVGVVLDNRGGALAKLLTPFKMFVGGPIGSGKQYVSWIHHDDLVGLILFALDHATLRGPLNGTAPNPVTNKEFGQAIGRALHRPSFLPTPAIALRLGLGEVADVITTGQRVIPKVALDNGYKFKFKEIDAALGELLIK